MLIGKPQPPALAGVTDRTLVRDVEAFEQPELTDLRRTFNNVSIGELRFAFNGLSIDEVVALPAAERARFIEGYVQTKRGTLDAVDAAKLGAVLGFTGLTAVSLSTIAENVQLIGLSKKDIEGAGVDTLRDLGRDYLATASTAELREVALGYVARETDELFAEIARSIVPTAIDRWSATPNSTFVISKLPYEPTINRALEVAFEADRLGKTDAAIALYRSVLVADPENPDALNRLSIAYGHKARSLVTSSDDNKRPSGPRRVQPEAVLEYAQRSLALAEKILVNAEAAGIYDPIANRISLPEIRKLAGNPELEGLVTTTVKALYNRAYATVKLREYMGVDPFTDGKGDDKSQLTGALLQGGLTRTQIADYFAHGIHPRTAKKAIAGILDLPASKEPLREQTLALLRDIAARPYKISRSELEELTMRYVGVETRLGFPTADQAIEALRDVRELTNDFASRARDTEFVQGAKGSAWAAMDAASVDGLYHRMTSWIGGLAEKQANRLFEDLYRDLGAAAANRPVVKKNLLGI